MNLRRILLPILLFPLLPTTLPAENNDTLDALRQIARPLDEAKPELIARLANARLALLGEASHGTAEFYTLRADISLALLQDHSFRFLAVEGDWNSIHRLNQYIKHREHPEGGARAIMRTFERWPQWMWANEEFASLVESLRDHNADLPENQRLGLYGIDVYGMDDALRELPAALDDTHPDLAAEIREHYACFARFRGDMGAYARAARLGPVSPCGGAARAARAALENHLDDLPPHTTLHLLQMARGVESAERHYRAMARGGAASWNHRATHFHQTVQHLLDHYGEDARGIVWAHNTHIGDARATDMARDGRHNIGQLARQQMSPDDLLALGFGTHSGDVIAGRQWGAPRQTMTSPPARPDSLEDLMHRLGDRDWAFFLDDAPEPLHSPIGHRAIGVVYHPAREHLGNYVPTILPERYDLFIFLQNTSPLTPID